MQAKGSMFHKNHENGSSSVGKDRDREFPTMRLFHGSVSFLPCPLRECDTVRDGVTI